MTTQKEFQKRLDKVWKRKIDGQAALLNLDWSPEPDKRTCPADLLSTSFLCLQSAGWHFPPHLEPPKAEAHRTYQPAPGGCFTDQPHFKGILCFYDPCSRSFPCVQGSHCLPYRTYGEKILLPVVETFTEVLKPKVL